MNDNLIRMWRELYSIMGGREGIAFTRDEIGELWDAVFILRDLGYAEGVSVGQGEKGLTVVIYKIRNPDLILSNKTDQPSTISVMGDAVISNNNVSGSNVKIANSLKKKNIYFVILIVCIFAALVSAFLFF